jgi:formamidopyrimidine-DNA glycosylase
MPELPEVETTRRGIAPHIEGQRIHKITIRQPKLRWPIPRGLDKRLSGQIIHSVQRRGKYLLIETGDGSLILHLGMSGSLRIVDRETPARKHDHVDIALDNGKCLRFHDPRRFGALLWSRTPFEHELISKLGPEPLSNDFSAEHLFTLSRGRKAAVKNFIMDSHVVVGVGNIYASEALFMAGIHPTRAAGRVSRARYEMLADAIKQVLSKAISEGGTTLRDFVREDGQPGYFAQSLNVYGRGGEPCRHCGTTIKKKIIGQRSSYYCPSCQK